MVTDYTIERISAELDAIFGRDTQMESVGNRPIDRAIDAMALFEGAQQVALRQGPLPLFTENPTAREVVSQHRRLFAALGEEDEFLEGMIRYKQRKDREALAKQADKEKKRRRR